MPPLSEIPSYVDSMSLSSREDNLGTIFREFSQNLARINRMAEEAPSEF